MYDYVALTNLILGLYIHVPYLHSLSILICEISISKMKYSICKERMSDLIVFLFKGILIKGY